MSVDGCLARLTVGLGKYDLVSRIILGDGAAADRPRTYGSIPHMHSLVLPMNAKRTNTLLLLY